jgi:hypothetical protein
VAALRRDHDVLRAVAVGAQRTGDEGLAVADVVGAEA